MLLNNFDYLYYIVNISRNMALLVLNISLNQQIDFAIKKTKYALQ